MVSENLRLCLLPNMDLVCTSIYDPNMTTKHAGMTICNSIGYPFQLTRIDDECQKWNRFHKFWMNVMFSFSFFGLCAARWSHNITHLSICMRDAFVPIGRQRHDSSLSFKQWLNTNFYIIILLFDIIGILNLFFCVSCPLFRIFSVYTCTLLYSRHWWLSRDDNPLLLLFLWVWALLWLAHLFVKKKKHKTNWNLVIQCLAII